jgi:DNA invertase Pin-like site-specific DNA recombinase
MVFISKAFWVLAKDRVTAGIRNAKANGKTLGRPKSTVVRERILELKVQGQSLRQIAANLGVGYGTVRARLVASLVLVSQSPETPIPNQVP